MSITKLLTHRLIPNDAPTLLFVHGFLGNNAQWDPLIEHYKSSYQILLLELPGHGTNSYSSTYDLEDVAIAIDNLLSILDIPAVSFIGHSMGGYVGCALATIFPARVNRLYLINSCASNDTMARKKQRDRSIALIDKFPSSFIKMAIGNLFTTQEMQVHASSIEQMILTAQSMNVACIRNAIIAMRDRPSYLHELSMSKVLLQYVYGSNDLVIEPTIIHEELELLPAQGSLLEGGHMSIITNHEQLIGLLLID